MGEDGSKAWLVIPATMEGLEDVDYFPFVETVQEGDDRVDLVDCIGALRLFA